MGTFNNVRNMEDMKEKVGILPGKCRTWGSIESVLKAAAEEPWSSLEILIFLLI
jgi:hypothetical protein